MRTEDEQVALIKNITQSDKWIFEGARFTASQIDGRLDRCDTIINLDLNRFLCTYRGVKRGRLQRKRTDIPEKDKQPFHLHHICGVLVDYPKKRNQRNIIFEMAREKGINVIIFYSQKEVNKFISSLS